MIDIRISPTFQAVVDAGWLQSVCENCADLLAIGADDFSVIIEDDEFIRDLNRTYRAIDKPTDVLSFEMGYTDPETGRKYLGDIVLSAETALRQAEQRMIKHTDEISLLIVHGLLHLLGYDHADVSDKKRMWARQAEVLTGLGLNSEEISYS